MILEILRSFIAWGLTNFGIEGEAPADNGVEGLAWYWGDGDGGAIGRFDFDFCVSCVADFRIGYHL